MTVFYVNKILIKGSPFDLGLTFFLALFLVWFYVVLIVRKLELVLICFPLIFFGLLGDYPSLTSASRVNLI